MLRRVFISSTSQDLQDYRQAAIEVCNRLALVPIAMEFFEAMSNGATEGSKSALESADIYVGFFAHRYGYIDEDYDKSLTEIEFNHAGVLKMPRLCFLVDPRYPWPPDKIDFQNKNQLDQFKNRIDKTLIRAYFTTVDDFKFKMMQSLIKDIMVTTDSLEHRLRIYLSVDIPESCNHWFKSESQFEFHPNEQFVPISACWHDGLSSMDLIADILDRLQKNKQSRLAISANYGQGKTFLAWRLILELAKCPDRTHIPFFFPLRDYSPNSKDNFSAQLTRRYPNLNMETLFRERDCLLILDAVDEIPIGMANSEITAQTLKTILNTLELFNRLAIIVTFRSALFSGRAENFRKHFPAYDVAFLKSWGDQHWADLLRRCEETKIVAFEGGWEKFYKEIERHPLRDLISRPMWCKMIIETRDMILTTEIRDETGLYDFYIKTYFEKMQKKAGTSMALSVTDKIRVMDILAIRIAYGAQISSLVYITDANLLSIAAHEFKAIPDTQFMNFLLHDMRTYSLLNTKTLSVPTSAEPVTFYTFGHASFQTFFMAHAFVELLKKGMETIKQRRDDLAALARQIEENESVINFIIGLFKISNSQVAINLLPVILRQNPSDSVSFGESSTAVKQIRRALLKVWISYSRTTLPGDKSDLSGFYLNSQMLSGMDLSRCQLSNADLNLATMVSCDLTDSNITGAKYRNTNFTDAKLSGASFQDADLRGAIGITLQ